MQTDMSTVLSNNFSATADVYCGRSFVVSGGNRKESLGAAVKRIRNERGLSLDDVRRRARGKLSTSYINQIENGASADAVSIGKLEHLARGLNEPIQNLFDIAIGRDHEVSPDEERLLLLARQLHPLRLRDIVDIAETFLTGQGTFLNAVKKGMLDTKAPVVATITPDDSREQIRRQLQQGMKVDTKTRHPIPAQVTTDTEHKKRKTG
jgi:transcriptional regulator with XRE-family HTH domain